MPSLDLDMLAIWQTEADRKIRRFEARQARRRLVVRCLGVGAVAAAGIVFVWLLTDALR